MDNYKIIETYKGYNILMCNDKAACNISDGKGTILNKVAPYYSVYVEQKKAYVGGSCYTTKNGDLTYIKEQIDKGIQRRKEIALELLKARNESRFYTYICNNVTIRVLFYGYDCDIFVNDRPLRNVSLTKDFTFEDVLAQVYYNKIAKYNVSYWDEQWREGKKYANYINKKTERIDLDILPIYEYINTMIEFKNENIFVVNVRKKNDGSFLINDTIEVKVNEVKQIKSIEGTYNKWQSLLALRNKIQFYE